MSKTLSQLTAAIYAIVIDRSFQDSHFKNDAKAIVRRSDEFWVPELDELESSFDDREQLEHDLRRAITLVSQQLQDYYDSLPFNQQPSQIFDVNGDDLDDELTTLINMVTGE